jgi:hypothetical protein
VGDPQDQTVLVSEAATWTTKEITERQEVLTQYALKAWPEKWN